MVDGNELLERIDYQLRLRKNSRKALEMDLNISTKTVSNWKAHKPAADVLFQVAQYLGVSVEWLITGHDPEGLSSGDRQLLADYHLISDEGKSAVRTLLDAYVKQAAAGKNEGVV